MACKKENSCNGDTMYLDTYALYEFACKSKCKEALLSKLIGTLFVACIVLCIFQMQIFFGAFSLFFLTAKVLDNLGIENRQILALQEKAGNKSTYKVTLYQDLVGRKVRTIVDEVDVSLCVSRLIKSRCLLEKPNAEYSAKHDKKKKKKKKEKEKVCAESPLEIALVALGKQELVELLRKCEDSDTLHSFQRLYLPELVKLSELNSDSKEVKSAIEEIEIAFRKFCKGSEESEWEEFDSEASAIRTSLRMNGLLSDEEGGGV